MFGSNSGRFSAAMKCALLFMVAILPVMAQTVKVTGKTRNATVRVLDDRVCLTSEDNLLREMPGMTTTFTQGGGSGPQSVVVSFVGQFPRPSGTELPAGSIRAGASILLEIDGQRVDLTSTNGGVLLHEGTATSVSNGTHGFTFATEPIAPGAHTAKIKWYENVLGIGTKATICVQERSLTIHHN